MSFEWVKDALLTHLKVNVPETIGITAYKNLNFDPANRILWLKVINAPIVEDSATLGIHGDNDLRGFIQIGVYQAIGTGSAESEAMLAKLNKAFKVPLRLDAPFGCLLRLESKQSSQGGQTSLNDFTTGGVEGVWDANYLTINWLAREPR